MLLLDLAGPAEVLRRANVEQDAVQFALRYVAPSPSSLTSIGLSLTPLEPLPRTLADDATVLIAGSVERVLFGAAQPSRADDDAAEAAIVAWLRARVRPHHRLVTICSGALLAGRAGLLDGRACTTHFSDCAELAALAPKAKVLENRLFVEDGPCLTSAGVTTGIDLMLHLVARAVGSGVAVAVARHLVVYLRRGGSDPQLSPWLEGRNHLHPVVHRVQDAVAADPAHPWTLDALAAVAGTSARHLSRLFNEHAAMSTTDYVNRLRMARARELLDNTRLDIERVAEDAGFGSSRHLRRIWRRFHASPPSGARG
ncbi:MAG: helix-turn-helix domain-containing protein [Candidatus Eremiobacteraeota bacterium]|nr:helix-turn-helix domain-containing protein [Candidatus Eremiobacteraeota bacterium]